MSKEANLQLSWQPVRWIISLALCLAVTWPYSLTGQDDLYLDYPSESRPIVFSNDSGDLMVAGWIREMATLEPLPGVAVWLENSAGAVTDHSGWFGFEPALSEFPVDLRIQRNGWDVVTLRLTGEAQTVRFFMQPIHISVGGCGSVKPAEGPVPPPNEVRLRLVDSRTNEPVAASV
jgi:hypothetical protein